MRVLAILILVALVAFLVGAGIIYVRNQNGTMSVNVDTQRLNEKAKEGTAAAKRLGQETSDELRRADEKVREEFQAPPHSNRPATNPAPPARVPADSPHS